MTVTFSACPRFKSQILFKKCGKGNSLVGWVYLIVLDNISIGLKGLINYRDSPAGRISKSMNRVLIHEVGLVLISLKSRQLSWFAVIFNWDH
jgi:hypothetical protein